MTDPQSIIRWWEKRRWWYNLVLIVALFFIGADVPDPYPHFELLFMMFVWLIGANILYTLSWTHELFIDYYSTKLNSRIKRLSNFIETIRPLILVVGIIFSVMLTLNSLPKLLYDLI